MRRPAHSSMELLLSQQLRLLSTEFSQLLGLLRALLVKQGYFLPLESKFIVDELGDSSMLATAWFEGCDIESIGKGFITANGRSSEDSDSFYVFNHARVYSSDANAFNTTFLGRPWRHFARVVWQNGELGRVVNPAGWSKWGDDDTSKLYFGEFNNFGPGAATGHRANFSQQLNKAVDIKELFGDSYKSEWWVDPSYL
ncbi:unnamed protein product [Hyaloperonospora brassicae]|uniref:pectinesterase n=1 Tax=Hyaloperonospora brassicae TaxID=162125 RepID=A0AAV0TRK9_HYABA|nr:unnamed protein product [Hyaloperonospora brassicae]